MKQDLALTDYQPQGMGHIIKLCAITTAGFVLTSMGGSALFAAPLALATVYSMFRGAPKAKDPNWIQARDEIWDYKLSPKHHSLADDYQTWCNEWGKATINSLIEPMIGQCHLANFTKDKKHPYHGLRNVIVYDHQEDDLPPLTPHDYVLARLEQRLTALTRDTQTVDVNAEAVPLDAIAPGSAHITNTPQVAYQFLLSLTTAPLQPLIIAGVPGSGKGVLTAMALSLGVRDNGAKFWVFNPKNKLEEAGYWIRAEKHFLKNRLQDDPELFTDLMDVLEQFANEGTRRNDNPTGDRPPFILVIEEVNALTGTFSPKERQLFKSRITGLASLLRGCNMAIWLSGQSITLEDLGLTGKSNRSMFTTIVALASDRAAAKELCTPLGIPYAPEQLKPNERYWLTGNGHFQALPAPANIPQFPSWEAVPNLIDLRPGASALVGGESAILELDDLLMGEPAPVAVEPKPPMVREPTPPRSPVERLEQAYKLSAPDEFPDVPEYPSELHQKLANYLQSKGEFPIRKIAQNWGHDKGLSSEAIKDLLCDLITLGLIDTFSPPGTDAEWVRWKKV